MSRSRFRLYAFLAIGLFALAFGGGLWVYREHLSREQMMGLVESFAAMGPWVFFSLMALVPLVGGPLSPFIILAPAFGTSTAIFGTMLALTFNVIFSWFVSGKWFRPLFVRIVGRFGYSVPEISPKNMLGFALLLRLTPGMPFPLQNYLLGLARMPLGQYLVVSLPIVWVVSASFIILGESIMTGNVKLAAAGIFVAVIVTVALRFWRNRIKAQALLKDGNQ